MFMWALIVFVLCSTLHPLRANTMSVSIQVLENVCEVSVCSELAGFIYKICSWDWNSILRKRDSNGSAYHPCTTKQIDTPTHPYTRKQIYPRNPPLNMKTDVPSHSLLHTNTDWTSHPPLHTASNEHFHPPLHTKTDGHSHPPLHKKTFPVTLTHDNWWIHPPTLHTTTDFLCLC